MFEQRSRWKYILMGCLSVVMFYFTRKFLNRPILDVGEDISEYGAYFTNTKYYITSWLSIVTCSVFAYWMCSRRHHYPRPPLFPGALPLIGNAHQALGDSVHVWNLLRKINDFSLNEGGLARAQFGLFFTAYAVTDPDDFYTVANKCLDKPYLYNFMKPLFGNGLVTADVDSWKKHRKMLNPAFGQRMINTFEHVFNDQARRLVEQLRAEVGKESFNPQHYLSRNLLDTSCQTILNMKSDDNSAMVREYTEAVAGYMDGLTKRFQKIWLHSPVLYKFSSLKKKEDQCVRDANKITDVAILKTKSKLLQNYGTKNTGYEAQESFKPLIELLVNLAADGNYLTDNDVRDQLNTAVLASYDTTVTTLLYALILIGTHQNVQDKIYKEIREVFGSTDKLHLDRHDQLKLVYLDAVLKETMRLYPAVPLVLRYVDHDVKLKNYTLEAGSVSFLSIYGVGRHPIWGADAEQFRPERWLKPGGVPDNPNVLANFSLGRRNCIGKLYAMISLKTTLVHLLSWYRVTGDASKLVMRWDLFLRPVTGYDISLKLRT